MVLMLCQNKSSVKNSMYMVPDCSACVCVCVCVCLGLWLTNHSLHTTLTKKGTILEQSFAVADLGGH